MTEKQIYEYGSLYYPYNKDHNWIRWFVKVAPIKVKRSIKILSQYKSRNAKFLDFGCGIGFNMYYFSKVFPDVIGIDNDLPSVQIAKKQLKKLKCDKKIFHYDGKKLPFNDNVFDIVNASDVWEHVENPQVMLSEIHRVLKSDGILYITNPNKLWPIETHYKLPILSYLPSSAANKYVRFMKRADRYDDIHLPTYGSFKKGMEEYFEVKQITFDFIREYKKYSLDKERGLFIHVIGTFLKFTKPAEKFPILSQCYPKFLEFLSWFSVGWVFLAWPKK